MKNIGVGFGVLCLLGALGQWMNKVNGEDVSILSIIVWLVVGVLFIWFSKFKKSGGDRDEASNNLSSKTTQIEMEESGRGYVCLDCDNSELFEGTSELYRLYQKEFSDVMDFNDEIVCPYEMKCEECSSTKIGIETKRGEVRTDIRLNGGGLCLIGSRKLVNFDSPELEAQILCAMGGSADLFGSRGVSFLNSLVDFDGDEEEQFKDDNFVIVEIVSKGFVRQDNFGLCDEDSTYKSRRAARF